MSSSKWAQAWASLHVTVNPGETWLSRPALVLEQLPSYCSWNILCSIFGLFWFWILFFGDFWWGSLFVCLFVGFGFRFVLVFLFTWIFDHGKTWDTTLSPPVLLYRRQIAQQILMTMFLSLQTGHVSWLSQDWSAQNLCGLMNEILLNGLKFTMWVIVWITQIKQTSCIWSWQKHFRMCRFCWSIIGFCLGRTLSTERKTCGNDAPEQHCWGGIFCIIYLTFVRFFCGLKCLSQCNSSVYLYLCVP